MNDNVNNPAHYTAAGGVECIEVTEHFNFCLGNAIKYIWRCMNKHESPLDDLRKAEWYLLRHIKHGSAKNQKKELINMIANSELSDWQRIIIESIALGYVNTALNLIQNQITIRTTGFK